MFEVLFPLVILVIVFFLFKSNQKNKRQASINREAGRVFLNNNAEQAGVSVTESGLQYLQLSKGSGTNHPSASSRVKVHYHGTLIDGTVFDSSVERDEPAEFALNQVIKGWTEGLQLMVEGEKMRFFIPSELAYGEGSVGVITPGSTLIFDVELLEIGDD